MTVPPADRRAGAYGIGGGAPHPGPGSLQDGAVAPRMPASLLPAIAVVRILPDDVVARLVNISASGMLVECQNRLKPGSAVTILFGGSFRPEAVKSRVARASVSGIGADGALRYHIGIAFVTPIELPAPVTPHHDAAAPLRLAAAVGPAAPVGPAARQHETLRNRW